MAENDTLRQIAFRQLAAAPPPLLQPLPLAAWTHILTCKFRIFELVLFRVSIAVRSRHAEKYVAASVLWHGQ